VRPVLVHKVTPGAAPNRTVYSGEVRARHETDLAFRIGGKIVSRKVDVGATVRKGELLASLDPADASLSAEAARAQVQAAETEYSFAKAELERTKNLVAQKFVSQTVYDGKLNSYNSTKAKLEQARSHYAVARNQSGYTSLVADQEGVITSVNAELGQVVAAGQAVMRLARPEEREVVVSVPENRLGELRAAREIAVSIWAVPDRLFKGRVREVSPNADPVTRTFLVKVSLPAPGPEVGLGMTANVILGGGNSNASIVLPLSALTQHEGKPAVWVVDAQTNKVAVRAVELGEYREDGASIRGGLSAGERVVTAGVHKLQAGQSVRAIEQPQVASR
jgi:RND family efflux transporter MFP subunit